MDAHRAAELIDGVTYRPTWFIFGQDVSPDSVIMVITANVRQSDVSLAPDYDQRITIRKMFHIRTTSFISEDDFYRYVFDLIMLVETHEAREFFAVRGEQYDKPFHPHTVEGRAAYGHPDLDAAYDRL